MELLSDCPALKEYLSILGDTIINFVNDTTFMSVCHAVGSSQIA